MKWLKKKIRKWLKLEDEINMFGDRINRVEKRMNTLDSLYTDLVSIGVDVHFKEPHMILIYSRLKGGQLREIKANFNSIKELNEFVRELRNRYRVSKVTTDYPPHFPRDWREQL